jgi:2-isopropylmalate synthase
VTGKGLEPMASVRISIAGELFQASSVGNGPVDAAIKAIKEIIKKKVVLEEFLIQAITRGSDDVGKVHMQVVHDDLVYYGFGANTDIVTASAEAFIDALNKIQIKK